MSRKKRSTLFSHDAEVGAHDVFQFLDELWVARDLEAAHDLRLQTVGLPVPHDGAGAYLQHCVQHCAIFRVLQVARAPARDLTRPTPSAWAMSLFCRPCAASSTMRARSAIRTLEHANAHSAREPCQLGLLRLAQLKNRGNSQSFAPT